MRIKKQDVCFRRAGFEELRYLIASVLELNGQILGITNNPNDYEPDFRVWFYVEGSDIAVDEKIREKKMEEPS